MTIDSRGRPSVAWAALLHRDDTLYATVIRLAASRGVHGFFAARTISHGSEPSIEPALATLRDGRIAAAWTEIATYYSARIITVTLDAEGRGSLRQAISGKGCHEPRVVVGANDIVTVAWRCRAADYEDRHLFLAARPAGRSFGAPLQISSGDALEPVLVIDAHATMFVFYTTDHGIRVRIQPPGEQLGPGQRVAPGFYPQVVAAGQRVTFFVTGNHLRSTMRDWIAE